MTDKKVGNISWYVVWWYEPGYGKRFNSTLRTRTDAMAERNSHRQNGFRSHTRRVL